MRERFKRLKNQFRKKAKTWRSETEKEVRLELARTKEILENFRGYLVVQVKSAERNAKSVREGNPIPSSSRKEKGSTPGGLGGVTGADVSSSFESSLESDGVNTPGNSFAGTMDRAARDGLGGVFNEDSHFFEPGVEVAAPAVTVRPSERMRRSKSRAKEVGFYAEDKEESSAFAASSTPPRIKDLKRKTALANVSPIVTSGCDAQNAEGEHGIDSLKAGNFCVCGKGFHNKTSLGAHIKWYTVIGRRFQCRLCSMRLSNNGNLKRHMIRIHKVFRSNQCGWENCSRSFENSHQFSRHIKLVHYNQGRRSSGGTKSTQKQTSSRMQTTLGSRDEAELSEKSPLPYAKHQDISPTDLSPTPKRRVMTRQRKKPIRFQQIEVGNYEYALSALSESTQFKTRRRSINTGTQNHVNIDDEFNQRVEQAKPLEVVKAQSPNQLHVHLSSKGVWSKCRKKFRTKCALNRNVREKRYANTIQCRFCNKRYLYKRNLEAHIITTHRHLPKTILTFPEKGNESQRQIAAKSAAFEDHTNLPIATRISRPLAEFTAHRWYSRDFLDKYCP